MIVNLAATASVAGPAAGGDREKAEPCGESRGRDRAAGHYLFSPHFGASLQMLKLEIGDRTYRYGSAGVGSLGYYPVRYPSFTVRQAGL